MISSAVIVPEETAPAPAPDNASVPTLKRRQSSLTPGSSKRPRLSNEHSSTNNSDRTANDSVSAPTTSAQPSQRPSSHLEDKKRGQRLFGALLGTLSQTSTKPAHRKRDEIERRQQERLRKENEEKEEEKRRLKAEVDRVRRKEQDLWEREGKRIRMANARAMAGFLRTRTEPRLYYRPWELRPFEEDLVKKQIAEVEDSIRNETNGDAVPTPPKEVRNVESSPQESRLQPTTSHIQKQGESLLNVPKGPSPDPGSHNSRVNGRNTGQGMPTQDIKMVDQNGTSSIPHSSPPQIHEHDRGGEELVQGDEDDVIY